WVYLAPAIVLGLATCLARRPALLPTQAAVGGELVRLVEDDKFVRFDDGLLEPGERAFAPEGIDADDDHVAAGSHEGIPGAGVGPGDDAEVESEQGSKLSLPVAHQSRRRDDQDPTNEASGEHLADVESAADRLARPRLVPQQEAQAGLGQHVV